MIPKLRAKFCDKNVWNIKKVKIKIISPAALLLSTPGTSHTWRKKFMVEITKRGTVSYLSSLASFSPCSREMGLWPLAFKSVIVFSSFLRSTCDRLQILAWPFQETISSRYNPTPSATTTTTTTSQHLKWLSMVHLGANQHYRTGGGMMPHLIFLGFQVFLSCFS